MQIKKISKITSKVIENIINLIFPVKCVCCKKISGESEGILCGACREILIREAVPDPKRHKRAEYLDQLIFPYSYKGDKLRQAISAVKRANLKYINEFFAKCMYNSLKKCDRIKTGEIDFITNAPRKRDSVKFYGYNQTEALAKIISEYTGIKYLPVLEASKRYKTEQKTLTGADRISNVQNKFIPVKNIRKNKEILKEKNILIIDDVITTGSTLSECARIMKNMGAGSVYALCAAGVYS